MPRQPNILFIICDDLAWGDLACHGNLHTKTPHVDQLRREGHALDGYRSGPVCTPARAALMTGRHPYRTRAIDTYCGRSMLEPGEVTVAEMLKLAGYRTALFGKWHLGDSCPTRPQDQGFDQVLMHRGGGLCQPGCIGNGAYFDPDLEENGKRVRKLGYCTDVFTDAALNWIGGQLGSPDPWFAYVAYNAPHTPLLVGDKWLKRYRDSGLPEAFARLYAMVDNIDWNVGRLLTALDKAGLAEDTLVVFTADHGPCPSANVEGRVRYNAGLRDQKGTFYEGGLRVPCFVRWPDRVTPGQTDTLANPIDWLPTLADLTGAPLPDDRAIDGTSLRPLLTGEPAGGPLARRILCMQWHRGDRPEPYRNCMAMSADSWKWLVPDCERSAPERAELYCLPEDPEERHNRIDEQPERAADLRRAYLDWFNDVSATREDNYAPPRIHIGDTREPVVTLTPQDWRMYGDRDGWQTPDVPGYWVVAIRQPGAYRVAVTLFEPPPKGSHLTLRCGDTEAAMPVPEQAGQPVFGGGQLVWDAIDLPAGPQRLEVLVQTFDQRNLGVRAVEVKPAGDLRT
ncbi:MAG: arylsulfatase [Opitutales bacterium]